MKFDLGDGAYFDGEIWQACWELGLPNLDRCTRYVGHEGRHLSVYFGEVLSVWGEDVYAEKRKASKR